ncbi:SE2200 family small protein [Staphylococcus sp. 11261D007BR]
MKKWLIAGFIIVGGYIAFKRYQQHVNKMPNIEY